MEAIKNLDSQKINLLEDANKEFKKKQEELEREIEERKV